MLTTTCCYVKGCSSRGRRANSASCWPRDRESFPAPGGALNAAKLLEMSEGFASYSDSTSSVEVDASGQGAAAREIANLLLAREGSTLQDILVG